MRRPSALTGAALGAITSVPAIALLLLGASLFHLPFPPLSVLDALARLLPGGSAGVDLWVGIARAVGVASRPVAERGLAVALAALGAAMLGGFVSRLTRRSAAMSAALTVLATTALSQRYIGLGGASPGEAIWSIAVVVAWAVVLAWALEQIGARRYWSRSSAVVVRRR